MGDQVYTKRKRRKEESDSDKQVRVGQAPRRNGGTKNRQIWRRFPERAMENERMRGETTTGDGKGRGTDEEKDKSEGASRKRMGGG